MKSRQKNYRAIKLTHTIGVCLLLLCFSTQGEAENTSPLSLPENVPAVSKNCSNCEPPKEMYTCPKAPAPGVPPTYDADGDRFIGKGDLFKVRLYLKTKGPGQANGAKEDINNDGFVDNKDVSDLETFISIVVGSGGSVPDECGICYGDGSSCLDCAGVPFGDKTPDICGVCGGPGIGECGCDLTIKKDCAGQCGGKKVVDACGVCGGPGRTGCDNKCFSTKVKDECGRCGGTGKGKGECGCNLSIKKDCAGVCGGKKKVDECGECGGDGPGECGCNNKKKDCAGVCGGKKVLDDCGVCGGNGKSCQEECNLYSVRMTQVDEGTSINVATGTGASLDCVKRIVGTCTKVVGGGNDCDSNIVMDFRRRIEVQATGIGKFGQTQFEGGLMDKNCNNVKAAPGQKICGDLHLRWVVSPISLLWDGAKELDKIALTRFPLSPDTSNNWYIWKASEKAPLLVFDPEHSLNVESYEQLFGNWTFGGKKVASLESIVTDAPPEVRAWRDGYEALASLDTNQDNKLTDEELNQLSLWFDKNQDGISQAGEVKKLRGTGVRALYVNADSVDPVTGDIHASLGYEREINGHMVVGPSVDWFGEGFNNQLEATLKLKTRGTVIKDLPTSSFEAFEAPIGKPNNASLVAGPWEWHIDESVQLNDKREYAPKGVLSFRELEGGILTGRSLLEADLKEPVGAAVKMIAMLPLEGTVETEGGKTMIRFSVSSDDGSKVSTIAELSVDGKTLIGKTTTSIPAARMGEKSGLEFSYTWSAKKLL